MLNFIYFKIPFNSTPHFSTLKVHSVVRARSFSQLKKLEYILKVLPSMRSLNRSSDVKTYFSNYFHPIITIINGQ